MHLLGTETFKKIRDVDQKTSVSGVNTSPSRVVQAVDLWPLECCPTPHQCLCEVAGYWREMEHTVAHIDPEHPKHAQCVTCLVSMQAMEELGHFHLPGNCVQILATWGLALSC